MRNKVEEIFIWDFHGTLETGTLNVITEIANTLLKENGSSVQYTLEEMANLPSFSWESFFMDRIPNIDRKKAKNLADEALSEDRFGHLNEKYSRSREGVKDVLKEVKKGSGVNVVISNSDDSKLDGYIEGVGLLDLIDFSKGIDDGTIESQKDKVKKKIESARHILEVYNEPNRVYVVGDSLEYCQIGNEIGAEKVFIIDPFGKLTEEISEYEGNLNVLQISNFRKILNFI